MHPPFRKALIEVRVAKDLVAERYGESRKIQNDMLGSFVAHGLTEEEARSESLLQVFVLISLTTRQIY